MIERILIAVDDSGRAPAVLAHGAEVARATGAAVRLFHAVAIPPEFPPAAATSAGDPLPAHMRKLAADRLTAMVASIGDVPCEILVGESHRAWRAILDAAADYDADLVVIGSHGYELLDRVLGTTAAKVVNEAKRDVLVVHPRGAQA